jgi:hypothetical protein
MPTPTLDPASVESIRTLPGDAVRRANSGVSLPRHLAAENA